MKSLLNWIAILAVLPVCYADHVGVFISFPDDTVYAECVDLQGGSRGFELLDKTQLDVVWAGPTSFGHQLCMIEGVGDEVSGDVCSYDGEYWGLFLRSGGSWGYMPVGFDGGDECWNMDLESYDGHYCARQGDLVGLSYGEFGEEPDDVEYGDVCRPLQLKRVRTYVDDERQNADEEGGTITAEQGSKIGFILDIRNDFRFGELEFDDITVQFTVEDADDGEDLEEEELLDELPEDEKEEVEIELDLPDDIEPGRYSAYLYVTGESTQGISQEFTVDFTLKVSEREAEAAPVMDGVTGSATVEFEGPEQLVEEEPEAVLLEEAEPSEEKPKVHEKVGSQPGEQTFLEKHGKLLVLGVLEFTLILITILVIVVVRR
jgi:hypothetical protein